MYIDLYVSYTLTEREMFLHCVFLYDQFPLYMVQHSVRKATVEAYPLLLACTSRI